ncbi:hypothetical protein GH714_021062 [Hevea brasiliensis]|uniref:Dof zinc finger protein n=1 Tax=Hevea brasiliensis TaxID=3981 RepID=A0A6A6KTH6_HEVBR|nr:hypothetical protein GH714_021062 [Hevea brasiliensis]
MERKWKPQVEVAPNCPRCASSNTKFCYYNNYSLSQPRYFCKGCRRYWTKGGSLRNVPVGGGCRKTRRAKPVRVSQNDGRINGSSEKSMVQESGITGSSSEIDLAVVFAKFLNQDSSFHPEFKAQELPNETSTVKNSSTPDSAAIECDDKFTDLIQESDLLLEELPPVLVRDHKQQEGQERIQELIESQDMDAFGLQTLLGDEVVQDALWSEAATLPNITWETVQPQQEFWSFSVDDQLKFSANLMSDNAWSSFDFPGFEVPSRPSRGVNYRGIWRLNTYRFVTMKEPCFMALFLLGATRVPFRRFEQGSSLEGGSKKGVSKDLELGFTNLLLVFSWLEDIEMPWPLPFSLLYC